MSNPVPPCRRPRWVCPWCRRCVQPDDPAQRAGEQAVGVRIPQIGFHGEGQPRKIIKALHIVRPQSLRPHTIAAEVDMVERAPDGGLQPVQLGSFICGAGEVLRAGAESASAACFFSGLNHSFSHRRGQPRTSGTSPPSNGSF